MNRKQKRKEQLRISKSVTLAPETCEAVEYKSLQEDVNFSRTLDLIVREWREGKEIEPLYSSPK